MTYREICAAKYGEAAAKTVHIDHCPDQMMTDSAAKAVFKCPALSNNGLADCEACWDSPAAIEDFQPAELRENDAEIRVEVTGESIHVQSHGAPADLVYGILSAVHYIGRDLYANGKNWNDGEKLIHMLQNALKPTSKLWDFSEEVGTNE